jgi:hypothetical protein
MRTVTRNHRKEGNEVKVEHVRLSKPYPIAKIVRDGHDLVVSIGRWYWRITLCALLALALAGCATVPDVFALRDGAPLETLRASALRPLRVEHYHDGGHAFEVWTYRDARFVFVDGALSEWSGK